MQKSSDFHLGSHDPEVDRRLHDLRPEADGPERLDRRFTQEEEFFLVLERPFEVPSFQVHHAVDRRTPSPAYLSTVRHLLDQWLDGLPEVFQGLRWAFDPKDLRKLFFYETLKAGDRTFLALVRPDLTCRPRRSEVYDKGDNDRTPGYRTRHLFLEAEVVPLARWRQAPETLDLHLAPLFPDTFEGQSGRGHFVTGRWIDHEVTRLLNRAALAPGVRTFPLLPLRCRHDTLAVRTADPTPRGRRRAAAALAAAWPLVSPWADPIQAGLKTEGYREDHPLVEVLRQAWGDRLWPLGRGFRLEPYLNEHEHKEYRYHAESV